MKLNWEGGNVIPISAARQERDALLHNDMSPHTTSTPVKSVCCLPWCHLSVVGNVIGWLTTNPDYLETSFNVQTFNRITIGLENASQETPVAGDVIRLDKRQPHSGDATIQVVALAKWPCKYFNVCCYITALPNSCYSRWRSTCSKQALFNCSQMTASH